MNFASRRDIVKSSLALLATLSSSTGALAYGTIPAGTGTAVGGRDARQQMRAAFGGNTVGSQRWQRHEQTIQRNITKVTNYFNADLVPNEYRRHYANHWRETSWWEPDHIYLCNCCFLILWHLCRETEFEEIFYSSFVTRERFVWHYEVTFDDNQRVEYVIDEFSRLRTLDGNTQMTSGFDGWVYYEQGRHRVLDRNGRYASRVRSLDSGMTPNFLYQSSSSSGFLQGGQGSHSIGGSTY